MILVYLANLIFDIVIILKFFGLLFTSLTKVYRRKTQVKKVPIAEKEAGVQEAYVEVQQVTTTDVNNDTSENLSVKGKTPDFITIIDEEQVSPSFKALTPQYRGGALDFPLPEGKLSQPSEVPVIFDIGYSDYGRRNSKSDHRDEADIPKILVNSLVELD